MFWVRKSISRLKKYHDYDDAKYKQIRDVGNLFNQSTDEDYYKTIKTKSAFSGNYIKYESNGDKDKNLSVKKYLRMIRPYLSDVINDHKIHKNLKVHSSNEVFDYETQLGEWKIQLTISINFISSKDSDKTHNKHTKGNNIEIMMSSQTTDIIEEMFEYLLQRYQEVLEQSMKGSEFIFYSVDVLHYHLQKTSLKRTRSSYIDSPEWIKNKKLTINPKNNDDNCFGYAIIAPLNHKQKIKNYPQWITNHKPSTDQYDWKGIDFPSHKKNWKNFELNNKSIVLNILFVPYNAEKIRLAYKSKLNFKPKNKVVLSIITDTKEWHYLAVKKLL